MIRTSTLASQKLSINNERMLERNIFICYDIHDIKGYPGNAGKWLNAFVDFLSVFLSRISKSRFKINLSGVKDIDLQEVVNGSSVFIFLLKPGAFPSVEFMEELKLIQTRCWEDENNVLLLKMALSPDAEATQIPFLSGMPVFHFFEQVNRRLSLQMDEGLFTSKVILEQLADMAYRIESFFEATRQQRFLKGAKTVVYLAGTTKDQFNNREMLKREIEEFGYQVLPDNPLPQIAEEFQKAVKSYLERSSMSIHIIGSDYGEIPKGEVHSEVDLQNKIAADWAKGQNSTVIHFSRLIWIAPDLKVTNDLQKQYIEN